MSWRITITSSPNYAKFTMPLTGALNQHFQGQIPVNTSTTPSPEFTVCLINTASEQQYFVHSLQADGWPDNAIILKRILHYINLAQQQPQNVHNTNTYALQQQYYQQQYHQQQHYQLQQQLYQQQQPAPMNYAQNTQNSNQNKPTPVTNEIEASETASFRSIHPTILTNANTFTSIPNTSKPPDINNNTDDTLSFETATPNSPVMDHATESSRNNYKSNRSYALTPTIPATSLSFNPPLNPAPDIDHPIIPIVSPSTDDDAPQVKIKLLPAPAQGLSNTPAHGYVNGNPMSPEKRDPQLFDLNKQALEQSLEMQQYQQDRERKANQQADRANRELFDMTVVNMGGVGARTVEKVENVTTIAVVPTYYSVDPGGGAKGTTQDLSQASGKAKERYQTKSMHTYVKKRKRIHFNRNEIENKRDPIYKRFQPLQYLRLPVEYPFTMILIASIIISCFLIIALSLFYLEPSFIRFAWADFPMQIESSSREFLRSWGLENSKDDTNGIIPTNPMILGISNQTNDYDNIFSNVFQTFNVPNIFSRDNSSFDVLGDNGTAFDETESINIPYEVWNSTRFQNKTKYDQIRMLNDFVKQQKFNKTQGSGLIPPSAFTSIEEYVPDYGLTELARRVHRYTVDLIIAPNIHAFHTYITQTWQRFFSPHDYLMDHFDANINTFVSHGNPSIKQNQTSNNDQITTELHQALVAEQFQHLYKLKQEILALNPHLRDDQDSTQSNSQIDPFAIDTITPYNQSHHFSPLSSITTQGLIDVPESGDKTIPPNMKRSASAGGVMRMFGARAALNLPARMQLDHLTQLSLSRSLVQRDIEVFYHSPNDNVFNIEHLRDILKFEQSIVNTPDYKEYCLLDWTKITTGGQPVKWTNDTEVLDPDTNLPIAGALANQRMANIAAAEILFGNDSSYSTVLNQTLSNILAFNQNFRAGMYPEVVCQLPIGVLNPSYDGYDPNAPPTPFVQQSTNSPQTSSNSSTFSPLQSSSGLYYAPASVQCVQEMCNPLGLLTPDGELIEEVKNRRLATYSMVQIPILNAKTGLPSQSSPEEIELSSFAARWFDFVDTSFGTGALTASAFKTKFQLGSPVGNYDSAADNSDKQEQMIQNYIIGKFMDRLLSQSKSSSPELIITFEPIQSGVLDGIFVQELANSSPLVIVSCLVCFGALVLVLKSFWMAVMAMALLLASTIPAFFLYRLIGYNYFGLYHALALLVCLYAGCDMLYVYHIRWDQAERFYAPIPILSRSGRLKYGKTGKKTKSDHNTALLTDHTSSDEEEDDDERDLVSAGVMSGLRRMRPELLTELALEISRPIDPSRAYMISWTWRRLSYVLRNTLSTHIISCIILAISTIVNVSMNIPAFRAFTVFLCFEILSLCAIIVFVWPCVITCHRKYLHDRKCCLLFTGEVRDMDINKLDTNAAFIGHQYGGEGATGSTAQQQPLAAPSTLPQFFEKRTNLYYQTDMIGDNTILDYNQIKVFNDNTHCSQVDDEKERNFETNLNITQYHCNGHYYNNNNVHNESCDQQLTTQFVSSTSGSYLPIEDEQEASFLKNDQFFQKNHRFSLFLSPLPPPQPYPGFNRTNSPSHNISSPHPQQPQSMNPQQEPLSPEHAVVAPPIQQATAPANIRSNYVTDYKQVSNGRLTATELYFQSHVMRFIMKNRFSSLFIVLLVVIISIIFAVKLEVDNKSVTGVMFVHSHPINYYSNVRRLFRHGNAIKLNFVFGLDASSPIDRGHADSMNSNDNGEPVFTRHYLNDVGAYDLFKLRYCLLTLCDYVMYPNDLLQISTPTLISQPRCLLHEFSSWLATDKVVQYGINKVEDGLYNPTLTETVFWHAFTTFLAFEQDFCTQAGAIVSCRYKYRDDVVLLKPSMNPIQLIPKSFSVELQLSQDRTIQYQHGIELFWLWERAAGMLLGPNSPSLSCRSEDTPLPPATATEDELADYAPLHFTKSSTSPFVVLEHINQQLIDTIHDFKKNPNTVQNQPKFATMGFSSVTKTDNDATFSPLQTADTSVGNTSAFQVGNGGIWDPWHFFFFQYVFGQELLRAVILATALVFFAYLLWFGNPYISFLALLPITCSLAAMLGISWFFGLKISITTAIPLITVPGLSSFSLFRLVEGYIYSKGFNPNEKVRETLTQNAMSILYSMCTIIASTFFLLFSQTALFRDFATMIWISFIFHSFLVLIAFPALLVLIGPTRYWGNLYHWILSRTCCLNFLVKYHLYGKVIRAHQRVLKRGQELDRELFQLRHNITLSEKQKISKIEYNNMIAIQNRNRLYQQRKEYELTLYNWYQNYYFLQQNQHDQILLGNRESAITTGPIDPNNMTAYVYSALKYDEYIENGQIIRRPAKFSLEELQNEYKVKYEKDHKTANIKTIKTLSRRYGEDTNTSDPQSSTKTNTISPIETPADEREVYDSDGNVNDDDDDNVGGDGDGDEEDGEIEHEHAVDPTAPQVNHKAVKVNPNLDHLIQMPSLVPSLLHEKPRGNLLVPSNHPLPDTTDRHFDDNGVEIYEHDDEIDKAIITLTNPHIPKCYSPPHIHNAILIELKKYLTPFDKHIQFLMDTQVDYLVQLYNPHDMIENAIIYAEIALFQTNDNAIVYAQYQHILDNMHANENKEHARGKGSKKNRKNTLAQEDSHQVSYGRQQVCCYTYSLSTPQYVFYHIFSVVLCFEHCYTKAKTDYELINTTNPDKDTSRYTNNTAQQYILYKQGIIDAKSKNNSKHNQSKSHHHGSKLSSPTDLTLPPTDASGLPNPNEPVPIQFTDLTPMEQRMFIDNQDDFIHGGGNQSIANNVKYNKSYFYDVKTKKWIKSYQADNIVLHNVNKDGNIIIDNDALKAQMNALNEGDKKDAATHTATGLTFTKEGKETATTLKDIKNNPTIITAMYGVRGDDPDEFYINRHNQLKPLKNKKEKDKTGRKVVESSDDHTSSSSGDEDNGDGYTLKHHTKKNDQNNPNNTDGIDGVPPTSTIVLHPKNKKRAKFDDDCNQYVYDVEAVGNKPLDLDSDDHGVSLPEEDVRVKNMMDQQQKQNTGKEKSDNDEDNPLVTTVKNPLVLDEELILFPTLSRSDDDCLSFTDEDDLDNMIHTVQDVNDYLQNQDAENQNNLYNYQHPAHLHGRNKILFRSGIHNPDDEEYDIISEDDYNNDDIKIVMFNNTANKDNNRPSPSATPPTPQTRRLSSAGIQISTPSNANGDGLPYQTYSHRIQLKEDVLNNPIAPITPRNKLMTPRSLIHRQIAMNDGNDEDHVMNNVASILKVPSQSTPRHNNNFTARPQSAIITPTHNTPRYQHRGNPDSDADSGNDGGVELAQF